MKQLLGSIAGAALLCLSLVGCEDTFPYDSGTVLDREAQSGGPYLLKLRTVVARHGEVVGWELTCRDYYHDLPPGSVWRQTTESSVCAGGGGGGSW